MNIQTMLDGYFDWCIDRNLCWHMSSHTRRVAWLSLYRKKILTRLPRWGGRTKYYVVHTRETICHCFSSQTCGCSIAPIIW
ncbi:hypothetical protein XhhCFBP4925_11070 [Xanthomonas hortorum pv. hederae]|uniref:Uncharacterized protein n=1 Tax=Xanthomonas hortorum pv. carotae TaxID=487904 RepID=A0A6V7FDN9_9XANT|nr:hypothetical protein [Xanthomonas hortorum]PPU80831.1 hypothetical protein XhhCFBP4925_11070 [Xanthomonas hortorum pv. hederae]PUE99862.1 hypothetical protein C7T87_11455 [Xanthomonas hortorum pv. hederae]CAD0361772.1 hypothetical protein CFBP7900_36090 [Xanthomonas hortorum pv. carotae]CAD0361773.1 hypothetical protein CFBP7900_36090 [Xanthomonas hortorum pv. carotae]